MGIRYLMKGVCRVTVMTVGNREGYAPMPYILWGQLPPPSVPPPMVGVSYGIDSEWFGASVSDKH